MSLRTRAILIGVIVVLFGGLAYPNLFGRETREASDWIPDQALDLGLDLRGGMHWLLRVDQDSAIDTEQRRNLGRLEEALKRAGAEPVLTLSDGALIEVRGVGRAELLQVVEDEVLPLELVGENGHFALGLQDSALDQVMERSVDLAIEALETRLNLFGLREPNISAEGSGRVLVQMPGVIDPGRASEVITSVTFLEFKKVVDSAPNEDLLKARYPDGLPEGTQIVPGDPDYTAAEVFLLIEEPVLTGDHLVDARLDFQNTRAVVGFEWDTEGARIFREFTGANLGRRMAAVIDDQVITAPEIEARIGRLGIIRGRFTEQEAYDLAVKLRSGALPVALVIEEERSVGPTLGADSIRNGVYSILIGGACVVIFMIVYYNVSGVLANGALLLNIVIIVGGMTAFGATLTLPGIAGLVLTVGMAVDANVIIFERIREELRSGKSIRNAVQIGFNRSRLTILDANVTTMIAAIVLYYLGRGPVKGFGTTLGIGIVSSVFCALFVTRMLVDAVVARGGRLRI